jgi:CheY-like chemotaxis protein
MGLSHALIVDDSRTSAVLLGKMLARSDLSSDKVASGEECLSYLAGTSPDIIFMDHMMPGMDGFDAVKAIKRQPRLAAIPIVMYTSKGGDMYRGQARALGAIGVLQKPAAEHDVADLLQDIRSRPIARGRTATTMAMPAITDEHLDSMSACDPMNPVPGVNNARLAAGVAPELPRWASNGQTAGVDSRSSRPRLSHALVVDDSRTSAALLGKMLSRYGLSSDKVSSGEECLNYLATRRPDVIFMDHMMPGMDGFEAVKAIKRQSRLVAIPIVMHTSKGGEMYIGQARALGAVGVLEKPASEQALVEVITELQPSDTNTTDAAPRLAVDGKLKVQSSLMPRQPLTDAEQSQSPEPDSFLPTPASSRSRRAQMRRRRRGLLGVVLILLGVLAAMWFKPGNRLEIDEPALLDVLEQLGNHQRQFEFGQIPFDDQRRLMLEQIVRVLQLAGVGAEIELRTHVGEFCRIYADTGKAALPDPTLPIEQCDIIGYEPGEAQALASSQSLDFRLFVEKLNSSGGPISIKLVPVGVFEPLAPYPADSDIPLAGDWNQIAARNQRVEMMLRPEAAPFP